MCELREKALDAQSRASIRARRDGFELWRKQIRELYKELEDLKVFNTKSVGLGGGQWAIEARNIKGDFLFEVVGENGTNRVFCPDGKGTDLWSEIREKIECYERETILPIKQKIEHLHKVLYKYTGDRW